MDARDEKEFAEGAPIDSDVAHTVRRRETGSLLKFGARVVTIAGGVGAMLDVPDVPIGERGFGDAGKAFGKKAVRRSRDGIFGRVFRVGDEIRYAAEAHRRPNDEAGREEGAFLADGREPLRRDSLGDFEEGLYRPPGAGGKAPTRLERADIALLVLESVFEGDFQYRSRGVSERF